MLISKKATVLTFIVCILILALSMLQLFQPPFQTHKSLDAKQELIQHSLIKMLSPYIQQSIKNYYGRNKQFMDDQILDISMYGPYDVKIKLQVTTFEGPHNPPYGTEVITLVISDKVEILDFTHQNGEVLPK